MNSGKKKIAAQLLVRLEQKSAIKNERVSFSFKLIP